MVLDSKDVITIAATGLGKSFPYWIPLLYIKYGIFILVTPLKLLGKQFVDILEKIQLCVVQEEANDTLQCIEVFIQAVAHHLPMIAIITTFF